MKPILNPKYILKHDGSKTFLLSKDVLRTPDNERIETVIHPIHAMILSFFDGTRDYGEAVTAAAEYLSLPERTVGNFTGRIMGNADEVAVKWNDHILLFPVETLIDSERLPVRRYCPEDFEYEKADVRLGRHSMVNDITLMLTTACKTDCIYCYAAKGGRGPELSEKKVLSLIDEAKATGVRSFDIIGGDVFAYGRGWRTIIGKLYEAGFEPYLSTKVALTEKDVACLHEIGIKDIQISLDTLIREHLCKIVNRGEDYWKAIRQTLRCLDKYGIRTVIHTIVCSLNCSIEDMDSIYGFISGLGNIDAWRIDPAAYSLPKGMSGFRDFRPDKQKLVTLYEAIQQRGYKPVPRCNSLPATDKPLQKREIKSAAFFKDRVMCSALHSHLFILPDGQVTICEQLYWNPRFIVGDVNRQSLAEVWNSPRSTELYNLDRQDVSPQSACSRCRYFHECRHEMGGVCWRYVVAAYGDEHWDFPDPSCPWAPKPIHDVFVH